jgi:hypothetical protein
MDAPSPLSLVTRAVALRGTHPQAPALDLLDVVFQGLQPGAVRFPAPALADDPLTGPRSPFGALLAEAFDPLMSPAEWAGLTAPGVGPQQVAGMLQVWGTQVLPRFGARYSLSI